MQDFLIKFAELYATAPGFCNWVAAAVPAGAAALFGGGYWLAKEINSGAKETLQAQVKLLEANLAQTKFSAVNANTAVTDAKREAARIAPPSGGDHLDGLLSTAVSESKVVVLMLNNSGNLATAIASGQNMKVPALEYKPDLPEYVEAEVVLDTSQAKM